MSTATIPCIVSKGFFESELYIVVGSSSAIVDRNVLRVTDEPRVDADGRGFVRVTVIQDENDKALVELPGEPVVGGLRTWIQSSELQEVA